MQRIRLNGIKDTIFWVIIPIVSAILLIVLDQLTKIWFTELYQNNGNTIFIEGVLSFTYVENTGSAFGWLSNKDWAQVFFKIITVVSLFVFVALYLYAIMKRFKTLAVSILLIFSGTIGNFIDRLFLSYVRDFIKFDFVNFAIFNFADMLLTFGVIIFIVHFCFFDDNALFRKSPAKIKEEATKKEEVSEE